MLKHRAILNKIRVKGFLSSSELENDHEVRHLCQGNVVLELETMLRDGLLSSVELEVKRENNHSNLVSIFFLPESSLLLRNVLNYAQEVSHEGARS